LHVALEARLLEISSARHVIQAGREMERLQQCLHPEYLLTGCVEEDQAGCVGDAERAAPLRLGKTSAIGGLYRSGAEQFQPDNVEPADELPHHGLAQTALVEAVAGGALLLLEEHDERLAPLPVRRGEAP